MDQATTTPKSRKDLLCDLYGLSDILKSIRAEIREGSPSFISNELKTIHAQTYDCIDETEVSERDGVAYLNRLIASQARSNSNQFSRYLIDEIPRLAISVATYPKDPESVESMLKDFRDKTELDLREFKRSWVEWKYLTDLQISCGGTGQVSPPTLTENCYIIWKAKWAMINFTACSTAKSITTHQPELRTETEKLLQRIVNRFGPGVSHAIQHGESNLQDAWDSEVNVDEVRKLVMEAVQAAARLPQGAGPETADYAAYVASLGRWVEPREQLH